MRKFLTYAVLLFFSVLLMDWFIACIKDDAFQLPLLETQEPEVNVNSSIKELLERIGEQPVQVQSSIPLYIEAYVVSSDRDNNFYKTLVIQDKPAQPTAGISIVTQATNLYTHFEPGRKIYFRVDGLYVGEIYGLPSIGAAGKEIQRMHIQDFEARILRSNIKQEIQPNILSIDQIAKEQLNTLIQLQDLEFLAEYEGMTYVDTYTSSATDRSLRDCYANTIVMRNNSLADFREESLPAGNGVVTAVLGVFYNRYQLVIRDTKDVLLHKERCKEIEIEWTMPFYEDFTKHKAGVEVELLDWTNTNKTGGDRKYGVREYQGNKFAQITAYGSREKSMEAWLVSPSVFLDKSNPSLSFETKDSYFDKPALKVYLTTDFTGDPLTTEWISLSEFALISSGHASWEEEFTYSGAIDLSAYLGKKVAVGFRYSGGDPGITTTYQIDGIRIASEKE